MKKKLLIMILTMISVTFLSCSVFYDLVFTPSPVFIMEEVKARITGELILSGTFDDEFLDKDMIEIDQTLYGQIRFIETSFGVSKYSVDFYWLELNPINIKVMMWFSKSSNSGYNARFRLYEESGASDTFLQLEKPVVRMIKSNLEPALQHIVYFIARDDYIFTKDDFTETDIVIHKNSFLEFTDYEYFEE